MRTQTKPRSPVRTGDARPHGKQQCKGDQELSGPVLPERLAGDHPRVGAEGEHQGEQKRQRFLSRRSTRNIRTLAIAARTDAESFSMNSATRSSCGWCQPSCRARARRQIERRHEQRGDHRVQRGEVTRAADHPVGRRLEVGDVAGRACGDWVGKRVSMGDEPSVRVEIERADMPEDQRQISAGRCPPRRSSGGSRCRRGGRSRPGGAALPTPLADARSISTTRQVGSRRV